MSHETDDQAARRRLRRDSGRSARGNLVSYESVDGDQRDWRGDGEAPYVKVVGPRHDEADDESPVKIGGHATSGARTDVGEADRVDASFTLDGQLRVESAPAGGATQVEGTVAHDDPDADNPVKIGGRARDEAPAAVADADRVNHYYTQEGRAIVNQDLSIAGENLVHDYLAVHTKPLDVEQDSWDDTLGSDVASLVVKTSAGRLRKVIVSNTSGSARWLHVFNATSLPAADSEPDIAGVEIPANSHAIVDFTEIGTYFDTGIVLGVSLEIEDLSPPSTTTDFDIWALFK